jgi:CRISPR/Cas system-associated endoribonuclease Cas2
VDLQDLLHRVERIIRKHENAIIYGSNHFLFRTERMIDLDKKEEVSRLKQFKSLTQFMI